MKYMKHVKAGGSVVIGRDSVAYIGKRGRFAAFEIRRSDGVDMPLALRDAGGGTAFLLTDESGAERPILIRCVDFHADHAEIVIEAPTDMGVI